jgi:hypothetical protein
MSEQIEEKFVADDGISTVEDPVTPQGGAVKKKKADVKKSVDPKADKLDTPTPGQEKAGEKVPTAEDVEVTEEIIEEEVISIEESVAQMFDGMDLSEEFKNKATLVFEAAVNASAAEKAQVIAEEKVAELEAEMNESITATVETMVENLDSYLDYVVEEWMKENELAIESGIKVDMAESLMDGLRGLFEEHNIEVDDEIVDVVAGLEEELDEIKEFANERINENVELAKEIAAFKAAKVFDEMSEGMTLTQRERLKTLSEKLDFQDIDEYTSNLETLKESFFSESKPVVTEEVEEEEIITEEAEVKTPVSDYASVNALVEALNAKK